MNANVQNMVLELLRNIRGNMEAMRADMDGIRAEMATKNDLAGLATKSELRELRGDMNILAGNIASDMALLRKDVGEQIAGLRRTVVEYHSKVCFAKV
jgi:hypothetical protein